MPTPPHRARLGLAAAAGLLAVVTAFGPLARGAGAATTVPPTTAPAVTTTTAPPTLCPVQAGNARFVRFVYLNLLRRCPDAGAVDFWTTRLDRGQSRWSFAESIDLSAESIGGKNVLPVYNGILGRSPTAQEYDAAFREIRTNHQNARVLALVYGSDAFYAGLTGAPGRAKDQGWIKVVFQSILGREADPAGLTYYTVALGDGGSTKASRTRVALSLELSNENMAGWTFGVFSAILDRIPDQAGFGYWFGWLLEHQRQTFRLYTKVLSTNESYALAQTQPRPKSPSPLARFLGTG